MVDIARPVGIQVSAAPAYGAISSSPYGISLTGVDLHPIYADIDGDKDLDLFVWDSNSISYYYQNTAALGASAPAYAALNSSSPFGISSIGANSNASPALADIDGDGDLDLFIGEVGGSTLFFRNTGSATAAAFAGTSIGFNLPDVGNVASPVFVDIDADGDLDLFIGNSSGNTNGDLLFFRNSGNASNAAYSAASTNPFGIASVEGRPSPSLIDVDGDGDLDLFIGNANGNTLLFRNTGNATTPAFAAVSTNPFAITDSGSNASPTFADIDNDGDLDLLIGNQNSLQFLSNTAAPPVAPVTTTKPAGRYGLGTVITLKVQFSERLLVTGSPGLVLGTGTIDRTALFTGLATTSLTNDTLIFTYTVQAGDSSADLTQLSSNALSLNGGTIKDAAGNDAILTLAASGASGSLGAFGAIVIDSRAPAGTLGSFATAPAYAAATTNPFGITNIGLWANPVIADAEGDGDLDLFIGNGDGNIVYFKNTAALGASAPTYAAAITNPFDITDIGSMANPAFVDADADGDLDLFVGTISGNTVYFENTAALGSTASAYAAATTNPFGITALRNYAYVSPTLADADGDGDLDLFIGDQDGNTTYFKNTAALGASAPAYAATIVNPFGITDVGGSARPVFADGDGDGDLDLFIGNADGNLVYFKNTASLGATAPAYAAATTNPFGITNVGTNASPVLADIDGDGDLDLFISNADGNTIVLLNTAATPFIAVASSSANGRYSTSDLITLSLQFSEAVLVTGTPRLQLETGATDQFATYSSGSGTTTLSFSYTVQAGDSAANLDQLSTTALDLNGGTIKDTAGNNAILTLAAPGTAGSLATNAALVVNCATVTAVAASSANGSYGIGSLLTLTVQFSDPVTVTTSGGTPVLRLETGATDRYATYASGSGTTTLSFSYTVRAGDRSTDLDQLTDHALVLNGGTIQDAAGNDAALTLAAPGATGSLAANGALVIDTQAPTGSLISSTAPAYAAAITNPFGITNVGSYSYASPVLADHDSDGDLDLFVGTIIGNTVYFENTASLGATAPAYAAATTNPFGITNVGTYASPVLTDTDADGDLDLFIGNRLGNTIYFKNTASLGATAPAYAAATTNPFRIIDIGDYASPVFTDTDADGDLDLFIGNSRGNIAYFKNTAALGATAPAYAATTTNPFRYISLGANSYASPELADADGDGDIDLFIGNNQGNSLFFLNTASTPVIPLASSTANGRYSTGDLITLSLQFSEAVFVTGTPRLQLETGATDQFATYSSGSGTTTLSFSYTVQAGDSSADLDQLAVNALDLDGGTIKDAAANNAVLSLASPGSAGSLSANAALIINRAAVTALGSSSASGSYGIGSLLTLTLQFSDPVTVTTSGGTPMLGLETGALDRYATYTSGTGTGTLSFSYTVRAGDRSTDLDQLSAHALVLNGGTIQDAAGNDACLTLAAPGATGSLAANGALAGLIQSVSQALLPLLSAWVEVGGIASSLCLTALLLQPISI